VKVSPRRVLLAICGSLGVGMALQHPPDRPDTRRLVVVDPPGPGSRPAPNPSACDPAFDLAVPTGLPAAISCKTARAVVAEVRARFATPSARPKAGTFAELLVSWLDPHGLWSDAPGTPTAARIEEDAASLLGEIEAHPDSTDACRAALGLGQSLASWVGELGAEYERARRAAPRLSAAEAMTHALVAPFEEAEIPPARELAFELGLHLGAVEQGLGPEVARFAREARDRFLPRLAPDAWQGVVLSSAVRAYVAAIDAHGQWAPLDEEWSLYADDQSFFDGDRLWDDMVRTPVGVRVVDGPTPPLAVDDLVLAVNGTSVGGMAVEHVGQLARTAPAPGVRRSLVVLRAGAEGPRVLSAPPLAGPNDDLEPSTDPGSDGELEIDLVPYGAKRVAVVAVRYGGEDLGARLEDLVAELTAAADSPVGMLLDLRGNGGGSTDGAADALGVFLPGVPAFPLLHAGRVTEVLAAPSPEAGHRFAGPLGVLVDARRASAAEMLAGALERYGRATLLGARTFGKGCVQEYFRDRARAGALRLTTHLFALPDGFTLQQRGLTPALTLDVERLGERERDLEGAIEPTNGPDVRVEVPDAPGFPRPRGRIGPCADSIVCTALRQLAGRPLARPRPPSAETRRASR
jgi:carboxyl-terminal processing protease